MTPVLLTLAEAAERARRHPETVRQWCKTEGLPYQQRRPRGPIHIWASDLDAFLGAPVPSG